MAMLNNQMVKSFWTAENPPNISHRAIGPRSQRFPRSHPKARLSNAPYGWSIAIAGSMTFLIRAMWMVSKDVNGLNKAPLFDGSVSSRDCEIGQYQAAIPVSIN